MEQQQQPKKLSVSESNFWLSLGQYLPEKRGSRMGSEEESEKINNWLAALLKTADIKGDKDKSKTKEGEKEEATKKRQSIFEEVTIIEEKIENESKIEEITFKEIPKRQVQRSFTNLIRRKSTCRKKKKNHAKYFGPLLEITFNLPRVSQQLERLMGSSVVRLTDRKYMLDLQKRIQEDYHDTLMKRISNRQSEEVKRELGIMLRPRPDIRKFSKVLFTAQSIDMFTELERERLKANETKQLSKYTQSYMRNREKLKTIRTKNAEELIKQGKRWERKRYKMAEQERVNEIEARKAREKMLEDHTLYIFNPADINMNGIDLAKIKSRKFTECEIDLKNFLLSERDNRLMKQIHEKQKSEFLKAQESKKVIQTLSTPTALRSQEISSFEEKQDSICQESVSEINEEKNVKKFEFFSQRNAERNINKSKNEDEDPRIEKFKNAETVAELYAFAELIVTNEARKNKLLKHIKIIKKSLKMNIALLKGAGQ